MISLDKIKENTAVLILEINTDKETCKYIKSIWLMLNKPIVVVKNSSKSSPLVIEIDSACFTLDKKIAEDILVTDIFEDQNKIFEWNQTKQREIILEVLKKQSWHFSLDEITKEIHKIDKIIWEITVYRCLKVLVQKWMLDILDMPDWSKKFEIKKTHHDHIICENCESIFEFRNEDIERLQSDIAKNQGVSIKKHKMNLIWGSCCIVDRLKL